MSTSYDVPQHEMEMMDLEEELGAAEQVIAELRALIDSIHAVAFNSMDDKYKVSEIRELLRMCDV